MGRIGPILCVAGLALPTQAALAQDGDALDDPAVVEFVVNNTISTLYHELGHAFVDLYGLPVLGREEDAADSLSTLLMLELQPDDALDQMMYDASDVYWLSDQEAQAGGWLPDYSDSHGLDLQRYFAVVCVVYGSDPERFQDLADYAELDPDRQDSCAFDYEQAYDSWWQLLEPHLRGETDAGGAIRLEYDPPAAENAGFAALAKEAPDLEQTVADLNDIFALPQDLVIRFAECDEENAWYDPADQSITMCYQIMASFQRLAVTALGEE